MCWARFEFWVKNMWALASRGQTLGKTTSGIYSLFRFSVFLFLLIRSSGYVESRSPMTSYRVLRKSVNSSAWFIRHFQLFGGNVRKVFPLLWFVLLCGPIGSPCRYPPLVATFKLACMLQLIFTLFKVLDLFNLSQLGNGKYCKSGWAHLSNLWKWSENTTS